MKRIQQVIKIVLFVIPAHGFVLPRSDGRLPLLQRQGNNDIDLNVEGDVKVRPDHGGRWNDDYHPYAYQYATSSNPGRWEPASIIYVARDEQHTDIKNAIQFAKENKLSLSIRSGGHQYLGFSSTNGRNIQLDMSSYDRRELLFDEEDKPESITLDVGLRLKQITDICAKHNIFFPHGECSHVALGGHVQTGGYTIFSRSLGMMIDFVEWFEIITADGVVRKVTKPTDNEITSSENDDLWFSVLGGSPGNFGVLTQVNIRVLRDKDVPSKAMFLYLPFTKECLQEALNIMAETNDNPDIAPDYNYNVMALSQGSLHKYEIDEKMREKHGSKYGVRDDGDNLGRFHFGKLEQQILPATVIVTAVYIGVEENDMVRADKWLADIDKRIDPYKPRAFSIHDLLNKCFAIENFKVKTPMSIVNQRAVFRWVREFDLPFEKRVYAGTSLNLQDQGFAEWATEKCWEINTEGKHFGCHLASQFIAYAGNGNKVAMNADKNPTALGHRVKGVNSCAFDLFYQTEHKDDGKPYPEAWEWGNNWLDSGENSVTKTGVGVENAKYSKDDLRFLYGPWGDNSSPWGKKTNLDDMWRYYFDDEEVYNRLVRVKSYFDPDHVFTPNSFSVGYNSKIEARNDDDWEVQEGMETRRDWEVIRNVYDLHLETPSSEG